MGGLVWAWRRVSVSTIVVKSEFMAWYTWGFLGSVLVNMFNSHCSQVDVLDGGVSRASKLADIVAIDLWLSDLRPFDFLKRKKVLSRCLLLPFFCWTTTGGLAGCLLSDRLKDANRAWRAFRKLFSSIAALSIDNTSEL